MAMKKSTGIRIAAVLLLLVATTGLSAGELPGKHPLLNKRFMIGGGGFFPDIDSKIRLDDDSLGIGTELDFEDQLGLEESKNTFWLTSRWRISRRNNLEFEWAQLNRDSFVAATTREYQIGESVLQAGGRIDSLFDIDLFRLTYGYSLIRNDEAELQLQAGVHIADLQAELGLAGAISINGEVFTESVTQEGGEVTAPLPHLGGNFAFAFTEKLAVYLHVIGFALELDDIEGSIVEAGGTLQYNFTEAFGVGGGLRYFNVDVEARDEDLRGQFEFNYLGPVLYANFSF
jgi:hypothetical protein